MSASGCGLAALLAWGGFFDPLVIWLTQRITDRLKASRRLKRLKLRDIKTELIRRKDASYAVACSAPSVYSVGKTPRDTKRNFEEALDLHLSALREKAAKWIAAVAAHR